MLRRREMFLALASATAIAVLAAPATVSAQSLDYGYFKSNIQPIFITKRAGYTRCIVCHAGANNAMRLTPLAPGAANFTEEQSKTNFETLSRIVVPGKPMESHFLLHPLQPEAGGGMYHSGGRQFRSTDDLDWKKMEAWVKGAK